MTCALDVTSKVSLVQFAMGGAEGFAQYFTEDDIEQVISVQPIVTYAAAILLQSRLLPRWTAEVDFKSGEVSYSTSQKVKALKDLIDQLRATPGDFIGGDAGGKPIPSNASFGGVYRSENEALDSNSAIDQPSFKVGAFDYKVGDDDE